MATTVEESKPPLNKTTALGKGLTDMGCFQKECWWWVCELALSGLFAQSLVYDDQPDQTTALGPHKHLLNLQLFLETP
jgi:hypothetical protein